MKVRLISFIRKYWREAIILIFLITIQSGVKKAVQNSERAYDYAADAASYARQALDSAEEASNYASEAADNASYCAYLQ